MFSCLSRYAYGHFIARIKENTIKNMNYLQSWNKVRICEIRITTKLLYWRTTKKIQRYFFFFDLSLRQFTSTVFLFHMKMLAGSVFHDQNEYSCAVICAHYSSPVVQTSLRFWAKWSSDIRQGHAQLRYFMSFCHIFSIFGGTAWNNCYLSRETWLV